MDEDDSKLRKNASNFFAKQHLLSLFLFVLAVIISQFYFAFFKSFLSTTFGITSYHWYLDLILAILLSALLYFLTVYYLRVPLVSAITF